jgi:hypothetical protein
MWMDPRHAALLYEMLVAHQFRRVLEIGCFNGASTSALVQSINDGATAELHLCDLEFRPTLHEVVRRCVRPVYLHQCRSVDVIGPDFDLILVDGDHSVSNVSREVGALLACETPTIAAHDVTPGADPLGECDGSRFLGHVFRGHPAYHCLQDSLARPGEYTGRGLLVATRDRELYQKLRPIWRWVMGSSDL